MPARPFHRRLRFPRKYLRPRVWRRWWRGPDRELVRREWHWFRHVYFGNKFARLLVWGLLLFYGFYPWISDYLSTYVLMLSIPAGLGIPRHISYYALLSLALSLPVVFMMIDVVQRRLRMHFHDAHIPHLLLSRIHPRELWPAILLAPALLVIVANILALTSTIGNMIHQIVIDYIQYPAFSLTLQKLPTVILYPFWLAFNILESLALFALVVVFSAPRFGWIRLFVVYFIALNINTFLYLTAQYYWLRFVIGKNAWFKFAGEYAVMLRNFFELFALIAVLSVVYFLLLRWALRRLRGDAFRRKLLRRIERTP